MNFKRDFSFKTLFTPSVTICYAEFCYVLKMLQFALFAGFLFFFFFCERKKKIHNWAYPDHEQWTITHFGIPLRSSQPLTCQSEKSMDKNKINFSYRSWKNDKIHEKITCSQSQYFREWFEKDFFFNILQITTEQRFLNRREKSWFFLFHQIIRSKW